VLPSAKILCEAADCLRLATKSGTGDQPLGPAARQGRRGRGDDEVEIAVELEMARQDAVRFKVGSEQRLGCCRTGYT
jgi:hypothetical protein